MKPMCPPASRGIFITISIFERGSAKHIVHSGDQHISTVDLNEVYEYHLEQGADVTLVYTKVTAPREEHRSCVHLDVDEDGMVKDIHYDHKHDAVYMEVFVMEKARFLEMADHCIAHGATISSGTRSCVTGTS